MQSLQNLSSWSHATTGDVPKPLVGPSITLSPLPRPHPPTVFLFGGRMVHTRRMTSDMYALDLDTMVWTKISGGSRDNELDPARRLGTSHPEPRYFHSMDVWNGKLVMFGGMTDTNSLTVLSDVWFFDCAARQWLPQISPHSGVGLGLNGSETQAVQIDGLLPEARYAHLSSVARDKLLVVGGQHVDNSYVYEINVFDLEKQIWVSKTPQAIVQEQNSKGAYRAIAVSSRHKTIQPSRGGDLKSGAGLSYTVEEEGGGGDIICYSNYEFANVRRELELLSPTDPDQTSIPTGPSAFTPPPTFHVQDVTAQMRGSSLPPGLRFPTGGIVGSHLILSGLYLASSAQSFSVWALNLDTLIWKRLETHALAQGSWNRAVIQPESARLLVFGNKQASLAEDYGRRAINVNHVSVISLETFGIYQPPTLEIPQNVQEVGLTVLDEKLVSDFEVVCDDGRKVRCSREILRRRWHWFAQEEKNVTNKAIQAVQDLTPPPAAATPSSTHVLDTMTSFTLARLTPRQLHLPEPFPVCVAFVQYLYTLSLVTPLQLKAPVLSSLLFLAKQYKIERLAKLVVHALHERLDRSIALGVYEIATLCGEKELQVRALKLVVSAKSHSRTASSSSHTRGPSASVLPTPSSNATNQQSNGTGAANRSAGGSSGGTRTPGYAPINPALQMASESFHDEPDPNMARRESETLPELPLAERETPDTPTEAIDAEGVAIEHSLASTRSMASLQAPMPWVPPVRHARSHDILRSGQGIHQMRSDTASPTLPPSHSSNDIRKQTSISSLRVPARLAMPSTSQDQSWQLETPSPTFSEQPSATTSAPLLTPSDTSFARDGASAFDYYFQSNPRLSSLLESPERRSAAQAFPPPPSRDVNATDGPAPPSAAQMPHDNSIPDHQTTFGSRRTPDADRSVIRRASAQSGESDAHGQSPSLQSVKSFNTFGHDFGVLSSQTKTLLPSISDEYSVVMGPDTGRRSSTSDRYAHSEHGKGSETASIMTNSTTTSSMLGAKTAKHMAKVEKAEMKAAEQRQRQARMQQEARARMLEFQNKRNTEEGLIKIKTASSAASSDKSSTKIKKTKKFAALWKATIDAAAPTGGPM